MKKTIATYAATGILTLALAASSLAGSKSFKEEIILEEPTQWWNANLSTGWDSLYMFRGVNLLRNDMSYGSSLYWTELDVTFNLTDNDFITMGTWLAFGLNRTDYKELNAYAFYTRTFGDFSLSGGYTMYYVMSDVEFSHELFVSGAYEFDLGFMTIIPSISYFFNVGPGPGNGGYAPVAGSYLDLRTDFEIPVYKDAVAIAPWIAYGTNFRFNSNEDGHFFNGANNLEFGIGLPIQLTEIISLYGYGAYSIAFNDLADTRPNTFWGGASVMFSF